MSMWKVAVVLVVATVGTLGGIAPASAEHLRLMPEARPYSEGRPAEVTPPEESRSSPEAWPPVEARPPAEARPLESFGLLPDVRLDMSVDGQGFRLGGRFGSFGAWLNGRREADGLKLGAEVQDGSRSYSLPLTSGTLEILAKELLRRWLFGD